MTPEERAYKIVKLLDGPDIPPTRERFAELIEAEIRAAVEEACANCGHVTQEQFKQYAKSVSAAAYEDAASIAMGMGDEGIANTLRARAKELK